MPFLRPRAPVASLGSSPSSDIPTAIGVRRQTRPDSCAKRCDLDTGTKARISEEPSSSRARSRTVLGSSRLRPPIRSGRYRPMGEAANGSGREDLREPGRTRVLGRCGWPNTRRRSMGREAVAPAFTHVGGATRQDQAARPAARAPPRRSPGRSLARSPRRVRDCRVPAPAGRSFEDGPVRSTLLLSEAGRRG